MKRHQYRVASSARSFGILAILFPGIAQASPFGPELIYGFMIVAIWLIALMTSLCNAKRWGWRIVLSVCLSLPLLFGGLYLHSVGAGVVEYWAREKYYGICQDHIMRATQVLEAAGVERPKSFIIDKSAEAFTNVDQHLADCVRRKETRACAAARLEFIELAQTWYETGSGRSRVCEEKEACRPDFEYYRKDVEQSGNLMSSTPIDKPVSDFVIRVGKKTDSGLAVSLFENAEKYVMTLEAAKTGKVFARTEILDRKSSPECPESANEIAEMILKVFPSR